MRKFILLLIVFGFFSCKKSDLTIISGQIENNVAEHIMIGGIDFQTVIPVKEDGSFADTLHLENDGIYRLILGRNQNEIYLEKGKELHITGNAENPEEGLDFSGSLGTINKFLQEKMQWQRKNLNYREIFSLGETEFLSAVENHKKKLDSVFKSYKISNKKFAAFQEDEQVFFEGFMIESYLDAHRYYTENNSAGVSSSFYDRLSSVNFSDTTSFKISPNYQKMLQSHYQRLASEAVESGEHDNYNLKFVEIIDQNFPNSSVKDKMLYEFLQFGFSPDEYLDTIYEIYKNSNPAPENLENITARYVKLLNLTKGNPSPEFVDYENYHGGTTSLEDLKGKITYIDIWATWCGPCIREIPYLKEIEKDYQDLQVVSISVDVEKDYDKWRQFIESEDLKGIQLMSDSNWRSEFIRNFDVNGIPRFILLDAEGHIITAVAPRPSEPLLREMLDEIYAGQVQPEI